MYDNLESETNNVHQTMHSSYRSSEERTSPLYVIVCVAFHDKAIGAIIRQRLQTQLLVRTMHVGF